MKAAELKKMLSSVMDFERRTATELYSSREVKDGQELEDWIYGKPPGRITFVTFAGLGAEAAPKLPLN